MVYSKWKYITNSKEKFTKRFNKRWRKRRLNLRRLIKRFRLKLIIKSLINATINNYLTKNCLMVKYSSISTTKIKLIYWYQDWYNNSSRSLFGKLCESSKWAIFYHNCFKL